MIAVINRAKDGSVSTLDTKTGRVDTLSSEAYAKFCRLHRLRERKDLAYIGDIYRRIIKYQVLGRNDGELIAELVKVVKMASRVVKPIKVPRSFSNASFHLTRFPGVVFLLLRQVDAKSDFDYLYSFTEQGIFCFTERPFKKSGLMPIFDMGWCYRLSVMDMRDGAGYVWYFVDKTLHICGQQRMCAVYEEPMKAERRKGKKRNVCHYIHDPEWGA